MTFEEWWKRNACKDILHCEKCKLVTNCATVERLCHDAWEASQLQSKDEIDALTKERNKWIKRCDTGVKKAWNAAQPKWTLCKDRLPKEKDGKVITTHETDASFYSHEIKVIRVYVKLETQNPFNETRIDNFCLSTNKFEKYEDLVIAWMPLPEAPAEINSGFNKQGANI